MQHNLFSDGIQTTASMATYLLYSADKSGKQILIIEFNRYDIEVTWKVDLYSN